MQNLTELIQEHSLVVRCLPKVVISYWSYRKGDEDRLNETRYYGSGEPITNVAREIVTRNGRKFIKETKIVNTTDLWYVKEVKDTTSRVNFGYGAFRAPTLEQAINLFLQSKDEKV